MADRPDPSFSWPKIPEGHEVVAVEDKDWRLTPEPKRCRWTSGFSPRRACAEPSVAELKRARLGATPTDYRWWAYCGEHLYGRWIEDGKVMHWILKKISSEDKSHG
jgi:hypothetical protein